MDIWKMGIDDLNKSTMRYIVTHINKIPHDDLTKVNLGGEDIDDLRYHSECEIGIGIAASNIDFIVEIEAIKWPNYVIPKIPVWVYYSSIPNLWIYTGSIGEFTFQGIASEFGFAVGKAIKAACRGAKSRNMKTSDGRIVSDIIEKNTADWRSFGFCH